MTTELITVFFITPEGEIAKAIIQKAMMPFFELLGAIQTWDEALTAAEEKKSLPDVAFKDQIETNGHGNGDLETTVKAINPDHGSGRPGSAKFHTLCIMEMQTADEISAYLQDVTGMALDARIKKLDKAQALAIQTIEDWLNENERQSA